MDPTPSPTGVNPNVVSDYRRRHMGTGDWEAWGPVRGPLDQAIRDWQAQLAGITRPWLCWSVFDRFCRIQQRLVLEFGWTPVVAADPTTRPPTIVDGSVRFDCNRMLNLPTMWIWFVLEFVYELAPRMAFWHSDFLTSRTDMEGLVFVFERLVDGETAAYLPRRPRLSRAAPCPGLAGCTTRGASLDQWNHGCGWWRWFSKHPNFRDRFEPRGNNWDHGYGIRYWKRHHGGVVRRVTPSERGHCKVPWSMWKGKMSKGQSIESFHNIDEIVRKLDIADLDKR